MNQTKLNQPINFFFVKMYFQDFCLQRSGDKIPLLENRNEKMSNNNFS